MGRRRHTAALVLSLLALVPLAVPGLAEGGIIVQYKGMDRYVGKMLAARVLNLNTEEELLRVTLPEISAGDFPFPFGPLPEGEVYRIVFFVDVNGNGRYDPPPTDHAWEIVIGPLVGRMLMGFEPMPYYTDIGWPPLVDGVIDGDEYRNSLADEATGMELYWQIEGDTLYVGLVSPGTGWAAVGFSLTHGMKGADIIIGAVTEEGLVIEDHYGSSPTSHRQDESSRITRAEGKEVEGKTTIEFAIPLASPDPNDVALTPGSEITVILAYQASSDSLTARHTKRSALTITLD